MEQPLVMGKHMTTTGHYVIRGGIEGRERLRVLSRVMRPTTMSLSIGSNCVMVRSVPTSVAEAETSRLKSLAGSHRPDE